MKKLIMFAAITVSVMVQAASVSWKVTNADYKNETLYAITGLTSSEVVALFSSTTESDWSDAVSGAESGSLNNRGVLSGASSDVGSTMVFAIVKTGIADGNAWAVTGDISTSGYTYTPPDTKPSDLAVSAASFSHTGQFTASVPEPTSGLLMLVGLAGLALRRRRA